MYFYKNIIRTSAIYLDLFLDQNTNFIYLSNIYFSDFYMIKQCFEWGDGTVNMVNGKQTVFIRLF